MNLKNLAIPIEAFTKGGKIIVTDVSPDYEFKDGIRDTTKPIGQKVTVVFPGNNYDTQMVRVANTLDSLSVLLDKATGDKPLCVRFVNFSASVYSMPGKDGRWVTGVSAKAEDVKPVIDDGFDIMIDD